MRWMLMAVLGVGWAPCAMAGQTSTMSRPFPSSGPVFEVQVEAFTERKGFRYATLRVLQIWGTPTVVVVKEAQGDSMVMDRTVAIGDHLEGVAYDEPGFDEEGNPLVVMKVEGELEPSTLEKGSTYLLLYPNTYFNATKARIKEVEAARKRPSAKAE